MKSTSIRWGVVAALGGIYLIWGSTFLAIRFAIEGLPPLTMAGLRFGAAGLVLVALCWLTRQRAPFDWPAILAGGVAMVALGQRGR